MIASPGQAKFLPPILRDGQYLKRTALLKRAAHRIGARKFAFIEAQAGQGKTTFAHQYLKYQDKNFAWYRVEPEDNDPLYLARGLAECLTASFPYLDTLFLKETLELGRVDFLEAERILKLLRKALEKAKGGSSAMVFDDCHHLEAHGPGEALLKGFALGLPSGVQCFFLSRNAVFENDPDIRKNSAVFRNDFLSFRLSETEALFREVYELSLSRYDLRKAFTVTGGWAMGLTMAACELAEGAVSVDNLTDLDSVEEYFLSVLSSSLTGEDWDNLLRLGLLDEFSAGLAAQVIREESAQTFIQKLLARNFFLRPLGDEGSSFEFHHLFREVLRKKALTDLPEEERSEALHAASRWCVENEFYEKALIYTMRRGDLDGAESLLAELGLKLYAANRLVTLHRALSGLPENEVAARGKLAYFAGLSSLHFDLKSAVGLIETAAGKFNKTGENFWELLAVSQALTCHVLITFDFMRGKPQLSRLMELLPPLEKKLPPEVLTFVYNAAAIGFHMIHSDGKKAYEYSAKALSLSAKTGEPNLEALVVTGAFLCRMVPERLAESRALLDRADSFLKDPRVSGFHKLSIRFFTAHYYFVSGLWENWKRARAEIDNSEEAYLLGYGVIKDFLLLQDIDYAILKGRYDEARAISRKITGQEDHEGALHRKSLALSAYSLASALHGDHAEAEEAINKSLAMRAEIGGDSFLAFQLIYCGAASAIMGLDDRAKRYLGLVLGMNRHFLGPYIKAAAHCHLALIALRDGDEGVLSTHLREFAENASKVPARCIVSLHPGILPLLSAMKKRKIGPEPNMKLVMDVFGVSVAPDGTLIPAMRIRAMGELRFSWGDVSLCMADLTSTQRQLVACLLSTPGFRLEKEVLAARMWPDSDRQRAISSFDMTLSRLRKTIDGVLGKQFSRYYLTLVNGVAGFGNCLIDVERFEKAAGSGFRLAARGKNWESANRLIEADSFWEGMFLKGMDPDEEGLYKRLRMTRLCEEVALSLSARYIETGQSGAAVKTVQKALALDPLSPALNKMLHDALAASHDLAGAGSALETYRESLRKSGMSPEEIKEQLAELLKPQK